MGLFDFLYYFIFKFYSGFKERGALSGDAGIAGEFQTINVLTGAMLYMMAAKKRVVLDTWLIVSSLAIFQITIYIRYIYKDNHSIAVIEQAWLAQTDEERKRLNTILIIYGVLSVFGFVRLGLYLGIKRK